MNKVNKDHVCTLYDGDYYLGVSALINSLVKNGFNGVVWVGYRTMLPLWLKNFELEKDERGKDFITLSNNVQVFFLKVNTNYHLTNFKAHFLIDVLSLLNAPYNSIHYFDCDIVVRCDWGFYKKWCNYGVAACQEILMAYFPNNHPLRMMWKDYAKKWGYSIHKELDQYFNAGYVGFHHSYEGSLYIWRDLMEHMGSEGVDLTRFSNKDRLYEFYTDQDMLNVLLMITPDPISTIGPEGMGFSMGGFVMAHAVGKKPWNINYIWKALKGNEYRIADDQYWKNVNGEIKTFSNFYFRYKKIEILAGKVLSKIIK